MSAEGRAQVARYLAHLFHEAALAPPPRLPIDRMRAESCIWCGQVMPIVTNQGDPRQRTVEHMLPKCRGGTDEAHNLRWACRRCNEFRSIAGHCIAALRCAEAVVGENQPAAVYRRFLRPRAATFSDASPTMADLWPGVAR